MKPCSGTQSVKNNLKPHTGYNSIGTLTHRRGDLSWGLNLEESDSLAHSDKVTPWTLRLSFLNCKMTINSLHVNYKPQIFKAFGYLICQALERHKATTLSPRLLLRQANPWDWTHLELSPPQQSQISVTWCYRALQHTWDLPAVALASDFLEKPNLNNMVRTYLPHRDSTSSSAAVAEVPLEDKAFFNSTCPCVLHWAR